MAILEENLSITVQINSTVIDRLVVGENGTFAHTHDLSTGLNYKIELTVAAQGKVHQTVIFDVPLQMFLKDGGEKYRYLHLSIRTNENSWIGGVGHFTNQVNKPKEDESHPGFLLQPYSLTPNKEQQISLQGLGLFGRALRQPGWRTRSDLHLCCLCDHCGKDFYANAYHSDGGAYYYCDSGLHTGVLGDYISEKYFGKIEELDPYLDPCAICSKPFRYMNPRRCPHCLEIYINFQKFPHMRNEEYYYMQSVDQESQTLHVPERFHPA